MEKISLNDLVSKTHKIIYRKDSQFASVLNLSIAAKFKCDLIPVNNPKVGVIPTMSAAVLLEA